MKEGGTRMGSAGPTCFYVTIRGLRGSRSGGVPSPVLEGEHKRKESPAGIRQPLVTAGEKQDLVFSKRCTEEIQHIGDAWGERERRALRNEGSPLAPHQRPLNPP